MMNSAFNSIFNTNFNNKENGMNISRYANNSLDEMNSAPRCPVILLLDTSSSMDGSPIDELNMGLRQFIEETANDEAASMSVELEVITFDSSVSVAMPFTPICDVDRNPAPLVAEGMTCMGGAIMKATSDLRSRRKMYRNAGISSYKPWVVLMTDGGPNDNWESAAADMRRLGEEGKIQYIGIEIGDDADHDTMCQILPANPGPVKLKGLRFKQFFRWLTDSLRSVSSSAVSDEDNVKLGSVKTWADLAGM
ncbi:MAG: VWA domain-containing protein [Victivallales bacterium]|nr:VWA domain-containing protein [Victivallales bacterium]